MDLDLDRLVPPPDPLSAEPWEVSVAELVRRSGKVPRLATKPLDLLDRFGAIRITADEVGFDDDVVAWDKVVELRTHKLSNLLTGQALEHEVDRIRGYLPPVPGRKWVVTKVVNLTLDLVLALHGDEAQDLAATLDGFGLDGDETRDDGGRVVAEIVHKGFLGRTKEVRGGLVAALVLSSRREVSECLRQAAGMRGIPVVAAADDDAHFDAALERSEAMRRRFDGLAATARRLRKAQDAGAGQGEGVDDPGDTPGSGEAPLEETAG